MMKRMIAVDEEKCIHCGMCLRDCVASCLEFDDQKIPRYIKDGEKMCLACQHCLAVCPTGAFSFGGLDPAASDPVTTVDSAAMLGLIKSRRSIRQYKEDDVPAEKIEKLKDMLAYPPTGVNAPSLRFSIIATRQKMDELRKITYDCLESIPADSPLAFLKDMADKSLQAGRDLVYRGAPALSSSLSMKRKRPKRAKMPTRSLLFRIWNSTPPAWDWGRSGTVSLWPWPSISRKSKRSSISRSTANSASSWPLASRLLHMPARRS